MSRDLKIRNLEEKMMATLAQLEKDSSNKQLLIQYSGYRRQYYSLTNSHFSPARYAETRSQDGIKS